MVQEDFSVSCSRIIEKQSNVPYQLSLHLRKHNALAELRRFFTPSAIDNIDHKPLSKQSKASYEQTSMGN